MMTTKTLTDSVQELLKTLTEEEKAEIKSFTVKNDEIIRVATKQGTEKTYLVSDDKKHLEFLLEIIITTDPDFTPQISEHPRFIPKPYRHSFWNNNENSDQESDQEDFEYPRSMRNSPALDRKD